jgi:hypothetical protein
VTHKDPLRHSPAAWFGITLATYWIALLIHEGAHAAVAHFVYPPTYLSGVHIAPRDELRVVAAGPAVTLAMVIACGAAYRQLGKLRAFGIGVIAFGLSRLLVIGPTTLLSRGMNDERAVANILGVSARLLWIAEALTVITAAAVVARATSLAQPRRAVIAVAAGIAVGWVAALTLGRAIGLPI